MIYADVGKTRLEIRLPAIWDNGCYLDGGTKQSMFNSLIVKGAGPSAFEAALVAALNGKAEYGDVVVLPGVFNHGYYAVTPKNGHTEETAQALFDSYWSLLDKANRDRQSVVYLTVFGEGHYGRNKTDIAASAIAGFLNREDHGFTKIVLLTDANEFVDLSESIEDVTRDDDLV